LHDALTAEGIYNIVSLNMVPAVRQSGGQFSCAHGPDECTTELIEMCAEYIYNSTDAASQWFPFVYCLEKGNPPGNAQRCAQQTGLNWSQINACTKNQTLSNQLFSYAYKELHAKAVTEVPTVFLNDKELDFDKLDQILKLICAAYTGPKPKGCN
jgi:hypothetical protein